MLIIKAPMGMARPSDSISTKSSMESFQPAVAGQGNTPVVPRPSIPTSTETAKMARQTRNATLGRFPFLPFCSARSRK